MELQCANSREAVLFSVKDFSNHQFSESGRSEFPLLEGIPTEITPQSTPWSTRPLGHEQDSVALSFLESLHNINLRH